MSPFDDDPFDELIKNFFNDSGFGRRNYSKRWIKGEEEERTIDFIQTNDYVYIVFELPGYKENEVSVSVDGGNLVVKAKSKKIESDNDYVSQKLSAGVLINKNLPKFVNPKNYKKSFKNGVLEVMFNKK